MRFTAFATAAVIAAAAAGSALAAEATDVDYLRASRCEGLNASDKLAISNPAALESFMKEEGRSRVPYVRERADAERRKAMREARSESTERQARLQAELDGPCMELVAGGASAYATR